MKQVKQLETVTNCKSTKKPTENQRVIFLIGIDFLIPSTTHLLIQLFAMQIVGFLFFCPETVNETVTCLSSIIFFALVDELELKLNDDSNMKNLPFTKAILNDSEGDITKRWSISFWAWSVDKSAKVRKFDYSVNQYKTIRERKGYAKKRIESINALLEKNYHFDSSKVKTGQKFTIEQGLQYALKVSKVSHATQMSYNSEVSMFLAWCEKRNLLKQPIDVFQKKDAFAYRDFMSDAGKAGKTINSDVACLKRMWNILIKREIIKDNPWPVLGKEKEIITNRNIAFTWGQVSMLSKEISVRDPELWKFVSIMYHTLARPNEIRQLQVYNIHLSDRRIYFDAIKTKSKKERWINIHEGLIDVLIDLVKNKTSNQYLFPGKDPGTCISKNRMTDRHGDILKLENVNLRDGDHTLYSWKHTGVIQAYKAGVDIKSIQMQCGHSTVAETDNYLKSLGLYNNQDIILRQPSLPL